VTMMAFIAQLLTSVAGGIVGGYFVVVGVNIQSRRQEEAALRALLVEVIWNLNAAVRMVQQLEDRSSDRSTFDSGGANPGWLRRSIWDSQLVNVVNGLSPETLTKLLNAYATLEAVPNMIYSPPGGSQNVTQYARGGWIDERIRDMKAFFQLAFEALRPVAERRSCFSCFLRSQP